MNNDSTSNRKTTTPIKVCCTPDERQTLIEKAGQCGLSVSNFMRTVGLGIGVVSIVDHRKVDELVRINGDLGRLGGLLKLWLANEAHFKHISTHGFKDQILATISDIKANQTSLKAIIKQVVKS
ncbi:MAG: conjugal transfer protein TraJ [Methyloglobulus sp.]|nr:conjugal transfer protein TraJ [Methyloglobulus sp.]